MFIMFTLIYLGICALWVTWAKKHWRQKDTYKAFMNTFFAGWFASLAVNTALKLFIK